jgi:hypothetical protein
MQHTVTVTVNDHDAASDTPRPARRADPAAPAAAPAHNFEPLPRPLRLRSPTRAADLRLEQQPLIRVSSTQSTTVTEPPSPAANCSAPPVRQLPSSTRNSEFAYLLIRPGCVPDRSDSETEPAEPGHTFDHIFDVKLFLMYIYFET